MKFLILIQIRIKMGQFYIIVNLDKGEYIDPADFGYEPKFWGFIYSHIPSVLGFLLAPGWSKYGTWGGDRIVITSDCEGNIDSGHEYTFLKSIDKTWQDVVLNDDETYNLYTIVKKYGTNICERIRQIYDENELAGPVVVAPKGPDTKYRISRELAQLASQKLTARNSEVYNIVITYIHENALFNPNDKNTFIIDDKLASLFNVESGSTMMYRDINVYLKSHLNI